MPAGLSSGLYSIFLSFLLTCCVHKDANYVLLNSGWPRKTFLWDVKTFFLFYDFITILRQMLHLITMKKMTLCVWIFAPRFNRFNVATSLLQFICGQYHCDISFHYFVTNKEIVPCLNTPSLCSIFKSKYFISCWILQTGQ